MDSRTWWAIQTQHKNNKFIQINHSLPSGKTVPDSRKAVLEQATQHARD